MLKYWETKQLDDVLIKTETVDPSKTPTKEFMYVDVSSVNNVSYTIEWPSLLKGKDAPSRARKVIRKDDIIFATVRPTLKRIAIIPQELDEQVCSTGYFVLRSNGLIHHKLLFYYLQTETFIANIEKLQRGASYPAITDNDIRRQLISFPKALDEQNRIVSLLDKSFAAIDKAIENTERNLENLREMFDSYLEGIFYNNKDGDWTKDTLGDIAEIEYGHTDKSTPNGSYRYIRITDIDKEGLLSDIEKVYVKSNSETQYFRLNHHDLLMARTGATFGKVLLYEDNEPSIFASYLIRIKFKVNVDNKLYWYFSKSRSYWEQANQLKSGAAQPQFNGNALKKIIFTYPKSLKAQENIIRQLDTLRTEISKLETQYKAKLIQFAELKKSILNKAFKGELNTEYAV